MDAIKLLFLFMWTRHISHFTNRIYCTFDKLINRKLLKRKIWPNKKLNLNKKKTKKIFSTYKKKENNENRFFQLALYHQKKIFINFFFHVDKKFSIWFQLNEKEIETSKIKHLVSLAFLNNESVCFQTAYKNSLKSFSIFFSSFFMSFHTTGRL